MSTKAFKNEKIEHFKQNFENAKVAILTDYRGLTVSEITDLRRKLQENQADFTVTKNTLCKIAIKDTKFEALESELKGPSAIAFGFGDEVTAAKVLDKFSKTVEDKCKILAAVLDGKLLNADEAKKLAKLPSKEELIAKIMGSVSSPASGIVYSVNGVMSALVRVIKEAKNVQ